MRCGHLRGVAVPSALLSVALVATVALDRPRSAAAPGPPAGFSDSVMIAGLENPTGLAFAPDGHLFVSEQRGRILVYDSDTDPTGRLVADFGPSVHGYWDRGLLGLALDPRYPTRPYLYVAYTYDHPPGDPLPAPRWGDDCPDPPGPTSDGCVVDGRVSRLTLDPASHTMVRGGEHVLLEGLCQQYPSHSVGDLAFGGDGMLYVSAGDGAGFDTVDYGQLGGDHPGDRANPCGDPMGSRPPGSAEGGALRAQSVRRPGGQPATLSGAVLRIDPDSGQAAPGNPLGARPDPVARRIVAYGLRNPFRMAVRPGTGELWLGDVGWDTWEEINRIASPTARATNFGWPCHEGPGVQPGYRDAGLTSCATLYRAGGVTRPHFAYQHGSAVLPGDGCSLGEGSSTSGLAFHQGGSWPARYHGALLFADYARDCIWAMLPGADGVPDPDRREVLVRGAAYPVALETGPGGNLYYADHSGTVRRVAYDGGPDDPPPAEPPPGSGGPSATIDAPAASLTWRVGDTIGFRGHASDPQDGALPAAALSWALVLHHCTAPSACHSHPLSRLEGADRGEVAAPNHPWPSWLELRLTATDADGNQDTSSLRLDPRTVDLRLLSSPPGLALTVAGSPSRAPSTRRMVVGSRTTIAAPSRQVLHGLGYAFARWSDGGAKSHEITAGVGPAARTAYYRRTLTLGFTVSATTVLPGRPVRFTGRLLGSGTSNGAAGLAVFLYGRPAGSGGPFTRLAGAFTDRAGRFAFVHRPTASTQYTTRFWGSAAYPPAGSANRVVRVRR
jgi:glucose/arabinose dehydrogenase